MRVVDEYFYMGKSIFISFRTPDKDIVLPLYKRLKEEGLQVFLSSEDLEYGEKWAAQLDVKMREADMMLAFITPEYLSMTYQVEKEWNLADTYKKMIFPVLYQVDASAIPHSWAYHSGHQYICIKELGADEIQRITRVSKRSLERGRVVIDALELFNEACYFADKGDWGNAVKKFEKVADDIADAYPKIIYCRLMLRQYKEAREAARNALAQYPNNPDTYFFSSLSNIAGRQEYKSQFLERSSELLVRAWEIKPSLEHCYLAICLAHLYNRRSYSVPRPINEMVQISKRYEFDENLLNSLRSILGI